MSGSETTAAAPDGRRHQIDGLRAIAMLGVFYVHFWNATPTIEHARVSLFFVVSGFLITVMLLHARDEGAGPGVALAFYIRRALRLLPALFIALGLAAWFDMAGIRSSILWHLAQMTNWHIMLNATFEPWVTSHLWSMNMLEDFYLIAPLVILFLPIRGVFAVLLALLVGSVVFRVHAADFGYDGWVSAFVGWDAVAGGALLALTLQVDGLQSALRSTGALVLALAFIFSPWVLGEGFGGSETYRVLLIPALAALVAGAWAGYRGPVGWVLGSALAQGINRISYGAYVYHLPLWWLVGESFPDLYPRGPVTFLVMGGLSLAVAQLSWWLVERHFAALKQRFPVHARAGGTGGVAAPAPA